MIYELYLKKKGFFRFFIDKLLKKKEKIKRIRRFREYSILIENLYKEAFKCKNIEIFLYEKRDLIYFQLENYMNKKIIRINPIESSTLVKTLERQGLELGLIFPCFYSLLNGNEESYDLFQIFIKIYNNNPY